jgi:hypothetical protein
MSYRLCCTNPLRATDKTALIPLAKWERKYPEGGRYPVRLHNWRYRWSPWRSCFRRRIRYHSCFIDNNIKVYYSQFHFKHPIINLSYRADITRKKQKYYYGPPETAEQELLKCSLARGKPFCLSTTLRTSHDNHATLFRKFLGREMISISPLSGLYQCYNFTR